MGENKVKELDIAEAPYSLFKQSDRLKPLDTGYKLSTSDCMSLHIRCHYLTPSDDIIQLVDEQYEVSLAVVAVIFVNLSNSLHLSGAFFAPDYQTHIPLYVLSQDGGDYISKNIDNITECRIMPERAEAMDASERVDHRVLTQQASVIASKFSSVFAILNIVWREIL